MKGSDPMDHDGGRISAAPISDAETVELLEPLRAYGLVVLAVSGGADSTCLMHLMGRWLALHAGKAVPRIEVATVDHGLRPHSAVEAQQVADSAQALGFLHTTLAWTGAKPATGIQEAARAARYELLAAHAQRPTIRSAVVTAHTEDDQAETLLMRLARGSGLDGLAAMPACRALNGGVDLVRPLLGTPRARLIGTLEAAGASWIEDPSNEVLAFERVRLRKARAALDDLGLTSSKLALSASRLGRARDAVEAATETFRHAHVALHDGIYASLAREALRNAPRDVRVRILSSLLGAFGGEDGTARLAQVEALETAIDGSGEVVRTLGGCVISAGRKTIRIFREPSGRGLPQIELGRGQAGAVWDRRFEISLGAEARAHAADLASPLIVRALGGPAYATLRAHLDCRLPSRPAASLPALWSGNVVVGVPDLIWPQAGLKLDAAVAPLMTFRTRFLGGYASVGSSA